MSASDKDLSWSQKLDKEKTLKLARERVREERAMSKDWITAADHRMILASGIQRLEQLPGKAKSLFGLTQAVADGIRKLYDEARREWAKDIGGMAGRRSNQSRPIPDPAATEA